MSEYPAVETNESPAVFRPMTNQKATGLVPAIFGCIFGIVGIFVLAIVFVPLAMIFGVMGLFRSSSTAITATSAIAVALAVVGFFMSPVLLIATGILFSSAVLTSTPKNNTTAPPSHPIKPETRAALSQADQQELFALFQAQIEKCWILSDAVRATTIPEVRVVLSKTGEILDGPTILEHVRFNPGHILLP